MDLIIEPSATKNYSGIKVEHRDKEIIFKGQGPLHCGGNNVNLFDSYNEYLHTLTMDTQDEIFDLYSEAKNILDPSVDEDGVVPDEALLLNNNNRHFLTERLRPIIHKVLKLNNVTNLEYFVTQNGYVNPPKDLTNNYSRGEFPRETTIDENSYRDIGRLIYLLRPLLPIISELLVKSELIAGKDYKEVVTGELIKEESVLMNHPGWRKIFECVDYSYNAPNKVTNPLRLELITKDSYSIHASYKALFSRLSFSHVPSLLPNKNLAKILSSIVRQFDEPSNKVKEKPKPRKENSQERSVYENYHLKEAVNAGDEMAQGEYFSFGLLDEDDVPRKTDRFKHQCIGLGINSPALVEYAFDIIPDQWDFELMPHMVKLMQLVFFENISYNIYYSLDYLQLKAALALGQVRLHEMGFPNLAVLMTAIPSKDILSLHGTDMFNLTNVERGELEAICDVWSGKGDVSTDNEAVAAAVDFFKGITLHGWKSTIDVGLFDDVKSMKSAMMGVLYEVELGKEIKSEFLELVQRVNSTDDLLA